MLKPGTFVAVALVASACTGEIMGGDDGDDAPVELLITAPADGSQHLRDTLDPNGWLVASVPVTVVPSVRCAVR